MKTRWHLLALAFVAFVLGLIFLREPGFGDDLTYWSFAFDLHERGLAAWQRASFHNLRWPVWGISWLFQSVPATDGLASYYGVPLLYLIAGALIAFSFGRKLIGSSAAGWAAGIAFVFHPLLDSVSYRPMPDLSEGVWGAAIMLAWWWSMTAETRARTVLAAVAAGVGVFVIEANRVTGVFIVPVLILCTLLFFPRRFGWLLLAGAVAALLYAGECYFYKRLFNNWLHDLTANSGNKGAKGTEFPNPWALPFRFIDTLWKGNLLAPVYSLFAIGGVAMVWRRADVLGRVVAVWAAALYLIYSCAPQSLSPFRPLVRDADRFLAALAVPISVLAVAGLWALARWLRARPATARHAARLAALGRGKFGPVAVGIVVVVLLTVITSRERFDAGFLPEMRAYLRSLPDGTKVFSHKAMRELVYLVDPASARRFAWTAPNEIINRTDKLEAAAADCTEFWYARKLLWLTTRKGLEKRTRDDQPPLASYLDAPERDWVMTRLLARGDTPDLIFYRRRTADSPPTELLGPEAPEWRGLIPQLPAKLTRSHGTVHADWPIPQHFKGRLARFEFSAACADVQGLTVRLRFTDQRGVKMKVDYLLKPYLYPGGGKEFFAFRIPNEAVTAQLQLKLARHADEVVFTGFRAAIEPR